MHQSLANLKEELSLLSATIDETLPSGDPLSIAHGNWSYPGISKADMVWQVNLIITFIDNYNRDEKKDGEFSYFENFIPRIIQLRRITVPQLWGNAGPATHALLSTLKLLSDVLKSTLNEKDIINEKNASALSKTLKRVGAQIRGMEARAHDLSPRIEHLNDTLEKIESVHEAADSFPEDIESLKESRNKIERITTEAEKDRAHIALSREQLEAERTIIEEIKSEAQAALNGCQEAYRASTSQGLAAAFTERSKSLSWSMWVWVLGLAAALIVGGVYGGSQIESLSKTIQSGQASPEVIIINAILCILSVGAPIWFAWMSTKQINQRFRLAEDYAFKASISRAYEGYRSEAARLDKNLELSLLSSALNRLDEIPLRLVEPSSHGSPLQELLDKSSIKKAIATVPNFAEKILKVADDSLAKMAGNNTHEKRSDKRDQASPSE